MATERGAATVEFAMFAMFLMLILSGIVDLGRGIYTATALDDAVQEGAPSTPPSPTTSPVWL